MDCIDEAQMVEEYERLGALHRLKSTLSPQEPQLRDLERGLVLCLDCEAPIPLGRLAVLPQAVRCIECQRDYDRELRYEAHLYSVPNDEYRL